MAINGRVVAGGLVPFYEDPTSPQISLGRESRSIKRTGFIDWNNIEALNAECYPAAPLIYGRHPTVNYLYVDSIEISPKHENAALEDISVVSGIAVHSLAKIEVTYTRVDFDEEDDGAGGFDLLSRKWSFTGEFMTLPSHSLEWEDIPGQAVQQEEISAAKIIPTIEHSITQHRRTSINWTAIRENFGKVNDGEYQGAADETLLLAGVEISFQFNSNGTKVYTQDLKFHERLIKQGANTYGWNHFLRADGQWKRLKDKAGNLIYPKTNDFADLFTT